MVVVLRLIEIISPVVGFSLALYLYSDQNSLMTTTVNQGGVPSFRGSDVDTMWLTFISGAGAIQVSASFLGIVNLRPRVIVTRWCKLS